MSDIRAGDERKQNEQPQERGQSEDGGDGNLLNPSFAFLLLIMSFRFACITCI